mgnify:CR=1 FL=1
MAKDVLIIGNGFDLYHKLPTRYIDFLFLVKNWSDFFDDYNQNSREKIEDLEYKKFNITLDEYGKLTNDSLRNFAKYAKSFNNDKIQILNVIISKNAWIQYFIKSEYEKEGWIDFETEIEKVLTIIEHFFTIDVDNCVGKMIFDAVNPITYDIINILINVTDSLTLNPNLYNKTDVEKIKYGNVKRNLIEELKIDLNKLIDALKIYMEEFVEKINTPYYSEQIKNLNDINLLTFNYTNTYSNIYENVNTIHYVHGSLEDNNIVLGASGEDFENLDYVYFQKYFQRIQKKTGALYKKWIGKAKESYTDREIHVYIMGHSLGMTDKDILADFFYNNKNVSDITIFYHNQLAYEQLVISLIAMFGKEFIIEQTGKEKIKFVELMGAVK